MPRVKGSTYTDKQRNKTVNMRGYTYYDTKTGRRFKTENQYRNYKARREEGRSEYQRRTRRKKLRQKGYTPQRITGRRTKRQVHFDIIEGSQQDVIRGIRRRPVRGFVQAFIPGEPGAGFLGGSSGVGPQPLAPTEDVPGVWISRNFYSLGDAIPWILEIDPIGSEVFFRVGFEI